MKAGIRLETSSVYTADRQKDSVPCCRPALPTNTNDREFHQNVAMPNFGISLEAGRWGVFRGTAQRSYEWLDLGRRRRHVARAERPRDRHPASSPRTNPTLNQALPGGFPLGVAFGDMEGRQHPGTAAPTWNELGQLGAQAAAQ